MKSEEGNRSTPVNAKFLIESVILLLIALFGVQLYRGAAVSHQDKELAAGFLPADYEVVRHGDDALRLYVAPDCPHCVELENLLRNNGVRFEKRDLGSPEVDEEYVRDLGRGEIPALKYKGQVFRRQVPEELFHALQNVLQQTVAPTKSPRFELSPDQQNILWTVAAAWLLITVAPLFGIVSLYRSRADFFEPLLGSIFALLSYFLFLGVDLPLWRLISGGICALVAAAGVLRTFVISVTDNNDLLLGVLVGIYRLVTSTMAVALALVFRFAVESAKAPAREECTPKKLKPRSSSNEKVEVPKRPFNASPLYTFDGRDLRDKHGQKVATVVRGYVETKGCRVAKIEGQYVWDVRNGTKRVLNLLPGGRIDDCRHVSRKVTEMEQVQRYIKGPAGAELVALWWWFVLREMEEGE